MTRTRPDGLTLVLLAMAVAALLYGALRTWPRTVDDAYITLRYARNVVQGAGPVFNPGESVEGYSTPSWMMISSAVIAAGLDPVPVVKVLGLLASVALLLVLWVSLQCHGVSPRGAALAVLLLGSSMVMQIWATSGMETNAYALLFFTGLVLMAAERPSPRSVLLASTVLVGAALTRPEGLAFWAIGLPVAVARLAFGAGFRSARGAIHAALAYLAPGLLLAMHLGFRLAYYGSPLPNTYYVKTGGGIERWRQGLHGLRLFAESPAHLPWIVAAFVAALVTLRQARSRAAAAVMAGATALHLLYIVSVGDDGLWIHRFYPPILGPLAFLVGLAFRSDAPDIRAASGIRMALALAALLTVPLSIHTLHEWVLNPMQEMLAYQEGNEKLGIFLRESRPPGTWIAVAAAGAIPYLSGLRSVDLYGLNDAHIAHQPFPAQRGGRLMKWDSAYVLSRRPDLIVINRGYFRAGDPLAEAAARDPGIMADAPMDVDLFQHIQQDGGYALRALRFRDGAVFFVFERS